MKNLRGGDRFPDLVLERWFTEQVFPRTAEALAVKLSNVTAAFYGYTLQQVGLQCGWDKVEGVSRELFRELGRLKAAEARAMGIPLPPDTRALGLIIVSAIYTSSPEYRFEFRRYTPGETIIRLTGACRYFRIAKKLNFDSFLTWPVLTQFFEGAAGHLGIRCDVEMTAQRLEADGTCDYLGRFTLRG